MHLQEMFDFPKAGVGARHFVDLASVDIDGAFGEVPHSKLIETLLNAEVDGYILRFICAWLASSRFKLRLLTPRGRRLSSWRQVTWGLPQGGVLPPLLWLPHFNSLAPRLREMREAWSHVDRDTPSIVLVYADDISFAISHPSADVFCVIVSRKASDVERAVGRHGLSLSAPKSYNFAISYGMIMDGIFRRGGPGTAQEWE